MADVDAAFVQKALPRSEARAEAVLLLNAENA
jgi:hypothetical protein